MAEFHLTISDQPLAGIKAMNPKPGDVLWLKLNRPQTPDALQQLARTIEGLLESLHLKNKVSVVVTQDDHDLTVVSVEDMERLGWVRKKGTS